MAFVIIAALSTESLYKPMRSCDSGGITVVVTVAGDHSN